MRVLSQLKDNFDDLSQWNTMNASATNGELVFESGSNGQIYSKSFYQLTGSGAFIELTSVDFNETNDAYVCPLDVGEDLYHYFAIELLYSVATESAYIWVYSGEDVTAYGGTIEYSPEVHKFFKIKEDSGSLYFQYSSDAKTWSNIVTPITGYAMDTDSVNLYIYATEGTDATLDNLNIRDTLEIGTVYPLPAFTTNV